MDIVSTTPLSVDTLLWEPRTGERMLTVCVKLTFSLKNGEVAVLAPNQEAIHGDIPWDETLGSSLYAPSDFVPTKPKVDILLSGRVFAAGGRAVEQLVARVSVDEFSKSLLVRGSRQWILEHGALVPGPIQPFTYVPIGYARDALLGHDGGATTKPIMGAALSHFDQVPGGPNVDSPPGFGATSLNQRALRSEGGLATKRWAESLHARKTMAPPTLVDWSFFNSAPRDQQIAALGPTPHILLENLHPSIPRLETWLPKVFPRVWHLGASAKQPTEIRLRCDTLRIDTDRGNAILTYRGLLPMARLDELVLGVMLEGAGAASGMDDLVRRMRERTGIAVATTSTAEGFVEVEPDDEEVGASTAMVGGASIAAALPFAKADPRQNAADGDGMNEVGGSTLPIVRAVAARELPFGASHAVETNEVGNSTLPVTRPGTGPTLPFAKGESALAKSLSAEVIARLSAMGSSSDAGRSTLPIGGVPSKKALPFGRDAVVPDEPPAKPMPMEVEAEPVPIAVVAADVAPPAMIGPLATTEMGAIKVEPAAEPLPTVESPPAPAQPTLLPIAICAAIAAEKAMGSDMLALLRAHDVTQEDVTFSARHWANSIAVDTRRDKFDRLEAYDDAYVAGLEKARGRAISVDEYAQLAVGMERGEANMPLSATGLPPDGLFRILRVWGRKTMKDRELDAAANAAEARVRRNDE